MKVRYRETALADLEVISRYLEKRSPVGARNVLEAIYSAVANLAETPLSARQTSDPSIRVKIVDRYRYKIFYKPSADAIEVLHIRHGARRPWYPEQSE